MASWANEYYRSRLPDEDQKRYDLLVQGWSNLQKNVSTGRTTDAGRFHAIVEGIMKDHPELFWVNYYQYYVRSSVLNTSIGLDFLLSDGEIPRYRRQAQDWQHRIARQIPPSFSQRDRLWVVYDYLARQVTYREQGTVHSHTIVGPMTRGNHTAVCEGIAKSFKFLCDGAGLPCIVVSGDADFGPGHRGGHSWNIVECDGKFYHVDVTCELDLAHLFGKADRWNFLKKDRQMRKYTWNRDEVPRCG